MVRYARRPLALVALLALLVSAVHSTSALRCLVDSAPAVAVAVGHATEADPLPSAVHLAAAGDADLAVTASAHLALQTESHPTVPLHECPHGEAGVMSSCAAAPALPTGAAVIAALPLDLQQPAPRSHTLPYILLGSDLFRPPRA